MGVRTRQGKATKEQIERRWRHQKQGEAKMGGGMSPLPVIQIGDMWARAGEIGRWKGSPLLVRVDGAGPKAGGRRVAS